MPVGEPLTLPVIINRSAAEAGPGALRMASTPNSASPEAL